MRPLPPTVAGPISECNALVVLNQLRPGATVSIFADDTNIGGGIAISRGQLFDLTAPLTAGRLVHARQELGGEASLPMPLQDRTQVQAAPADMSSMFVHLDTIVYRCGGCLRISSAVPGARVHVLSASVERGAATAVNGSAIIDLSSATSQGEILEIKQVACGIEGPSLPVPAENNFPGPPLQRFPRPGLGRLRACDRGITATRVVAGARLIAVRSSGPAHFACATAGTRLTLGATPELEEGETVSVHQEFPDCGITSDTIQSTVGPAAPVEAPSVFPNICAGATKVRIRNLRTGALVHIRVDGTVLGEAEASGTAQVFQLGSGLSAGSLVSAAQTICGVLSEESEAIEVASAPSEIDKPSIAGPLQECAPAVMVRELTVGAQVIIREEAGGPRSDSVFVTDDVAVIGVSPALSAGESLVASIHSCGIQRDSDPITVEELKVELRPPGITRPVFDGANSLEIVGIFAGATVEISVDDVWTYSFFAPESSRIVPVDDLPAGTGFRTRQRLCDKVSPRSSRVVVRPPAPRIVSDSPLPEGEVDAPYSTQIVATGGVPPYDWDTVGGLVPSGLDLNADTGVLEGAPEIDGHYGFDVEVRDSGPDPLSDEKHFKMRTRDGSTEPPSGVARVAIFNCHTDKRTIRIWAADLTSGTGWQEKGTLAAQYDASGCPAANAEPFELLLEDGHTYMVAATDPDNDQCPSDQDFPNVQGECIRLQPQSFAGSDGGGVQEIKVA